MCKITAVFHNLPAVEVDQPCLNECLSIVHTFAKIYNQQGDCFDSAGRLVAKVAPGAQEIMPWAKKLLA